MDGTLAQAIALVTHGNLFLRSGTIDPNFITRNSTFNFCKSVSFLEINKMPILGIKRNNSYASNPLGWFNRLRDEGCLGLSMYYLRSQGSVQDHQFARPVSEGGQWILRTKFKDYSSLWYSQWAASGENVSEGAGWIVKYIKYFTNKANVLTTSGLFESKLALCSALDRIIEFTDSQDLTQWKVLFTEAKAEIESSEAGKTGYYLDMIPDGVGNLHARKLLFAAAKCNYFGGMGTWNDMGFDSDEVGMRYKEVSAQLYHAMCQAFSSGSNLLYSA